MMQHVWPVLVVPSLWYDWHIVSHNKERGKKYRRSKGSLTKLRAVIKNMHVVCLEGRRFLNVE